MVLTKGEERYVFVFDDDKEHHEMLIRSLGRYAADPRLSFTWFDAANLAWQVQNRE
jgi:hypothetical protein